MSPLHSERKGLAVNEGSAAGGSDFSHGQEEIVMRQYKFATWKMNPIDLIVEVIINLAQNNALATML
ncbi:similar to An14g04670 [Aspergillus luchuensis]|uniref:Similar to An14g04670 n=1 Tax=Aspergillus kawachii TaxID=1069201 RepID=A0A146FKC9_ASPKA|nr:similar to An14g04670 [Aspergillus luchuensis]